MTKKRCTDCEVVKLTDQFNDRTSNGRTYKMSVCRPCEKLRQQKYYRYRKLLTKLQGDKG